MAINNNADDYANGRIGIYFPASTNGTLNDGDLTGQCVSLTKWFLYEMTQVPNPGAARGNAKDVGDTLVRQGHADVISAENRRRGDFVIWKQDGGGYGHIGVLLSGDRVFEQNVGLAGTPSKKVGSNTVYASRIDPLFASWRKGAATYYRIRTYKEEGERKLMNKDDLNYIYQYGPLRRARGGDEGSDVYLNKTAAFVINDHANSAEGKAKEQEIANAYTQAARIPELERQLAEKPKEVVVEKPVEVIKEVVKEVPVETVVYQDKIVEVVKGDSDRTAWELILAGLMKVFNKK